MLILINQIEILEVYQHDNRIEDQKNYRRFFTFNCPINVGQTCKVLSFFWAKNWQRKNFPVVPPASSNSAAPGLRLPLTVPADQLVGLNIAYTYDALGRLTKADYSDGTFFHYTYDAVGNRLTQTTQLGTVNYVYTSNKLSSVTNSSGTNEFTWDNNGNLLNDGTSSYQYNTANQLVGVIIGNKHISYQYNGLGARVSQTVNDVTTNYVLDQAAGLTQVLSDGSYTYLYGNDRIAQQSTSETEYFLTDALGSVRQTTNSDGEIRLNRSYDPYGVVLASEGDGESVYAFTGEQVDSNSNLIYLRSRYLSPETGRFLSRDSWGGNYRSPQSFNKWLYVSDNPINRIDPLGLWELAPGLNLHQGGMYGEGELEMQPCEGGCYGPPQSISIFVPPIKNGKLYNDQSYGRFGYTDIHLIKRWAEYDILHKMGMIDCSGEIVIARNTDDWKVVYQLHGKSYAFSHGAFVDSTVSIALAMGYDDGFVPIDITLDQSSYLSNNWSIALQLFAAQSREERENFNLVEMFDQANNDQFEARVGGIVYLAQGLKGIRAFNSREFTIIVQEHKRSPGFYRAIIETTSAYRAVKSGRVIIPSYFLSFTNNSWNEQLFNIASSR
jgi:RHS repeat-associated protein